MIDIDNFATPARVARTLALLFAAGVFTACNTESLTRVDIPDVATGGAISGKDGLPTLLAGAVGEFQVAFGGSSNTEGQAALSGLFTDELANVSTYSQHREVDARAIPIDNSIMTSTFLALQRARNRAEVTAAAYADLDPSAPGRAQALNLAGFSYVLFGENYCSGVAFSTANPDGSFTFGNPIGTDSVFGLALAKFDQAAAAAAGSGEEPVAATQLTLARLGQARALLSLGRYAEAKSAVDGIGPGFTYLVEHSANSNRQANGVYSYALSQRRFTVPDGEGTNGIAWRSDADPRTRWSLGTGASQDNSPVWYAQQKYLDRADDIVLASGIEAELIRTEAELADGDANWISRLNTLRATAGLDPLAEPAATDDKVRLLFRERAAWLWLTGHRLGDLRRLVRNYHFAVESVYPVGVADERTGPYGTDLSFPQSTDEQNNPNYVQCNTSVP
jgi:starch-binding outer membrane protein, SusD/RagB family